MSLLKLQLGYLLVDMPLVHLHCFEHQQMLFAEPSRHCSDFIAGDCCRRHPLLPGPARIPARSRLMMPIST